MNLNINHELEPFRYIDIEPPNEEVLITIDNKIILSSKNMCMLSGLPKSNKSTINLIMLMSFLTARSIEGISVKSTGKALYIDTELSNLSFFRAFARVKNICGIKDSQLDMDKYDIFLFRMLSKEEILRNIISILESEPEYNYLFIDGLLDLCNNFNDIEETKEVMSILQKITERYNVAIIFVLHLGKSNLFSLGHIGSCAERKTESSIIVKVEDADRPHIITIQSKYLRSDLPFKDIRLNLNHLIEDNN